MKGEKFLEIWGKNKLLGSIFISLVVFGMGYVLLKDHEDLEESFLEVNEEIQTQNFKKPLGITNKVDSVPRVTKVSKKSKKRSVIKYRAPMIVIRKGISQLPIGSEIKVRLLGELDTRYPRKMVRVLLPDPATFKGEVILPEKTLLFGKVVSSSRKEQVEVYFSRGVSPQGIEFNFSAQSFIKGGDAVRMAKSVGLSVVSDMARVLTKKKALGKKVGYRSTLPNALIYATGEAARKEAERNLEHIWHVKVARGTLLTLYVTETFSRGWVD